jgi:hypothetical protein
MLDKLLDNYNSYEKTTIPLRQDSVIAYAYSIVETQSLIELNKSRLQRQTVKSPAIIELIKELERSKGLETIVRDLTLDDKCGIIIFTDLENEKVLYVLKYQPVQG